MSPVTIAARAAQRNATTTPLLSKLYRSQFGRSIQSFTNPLAIARADRAKPDWGRQFRKVGGTAVGLYAPVVSTLMFWPFAAIPFMQYMQS